MRAVVAVESGVIEVNWTWLPTFIGMNTRVKEELEKAIAEQIEGRALDDTTLDLAHDLVIQFLEQKYSGIKGLSEYLDGLKFVYYT